VTARGLTVAAERGRADRRAFVELPYRLYRDAPFWVPPLRIAERALMDRRSNPFFRHAEVEHFLARRGDRVVGRVAAIENRLHNEVHGDRVGFFGFFEVEPDPEAARALVEAARAWCAARGLSPVRGPVCYSTNDTCGVLVEGFDAPPTILMPYNRPDYDALLTAAGLRGAKDLLAYRIPSSPGLPERFHRVVRRSLARSKVHLRPLDFSDFEREASLLEDLYNRSWERNWGFVPATHEEFQHAAKDLVTLVHSDLSRVAERDGVPVGFSVFLRDLNRLLRGTSGRLLPTLWWRLWRGLPRVQESRCILLGVVPEARRLGINEAFFVHAYEVGARLGLSGAEAGWILEDNAAMRAPIEAAQGRIVKRYRMYETAAE
jgi:GNAT superfamily N-acetyltransferase